MNWLKNLFTSGKREETSPGPDASKEDLANGASEQPILRFATSIEGIEHKVKGRRLHVTLALRTPLAILLRHGEVHTNNFTEPPYIPMRDGIWIPIFKMWREIGVDIDEFKSESGYASDIGYVDADTYLPFLVEFRKIVESDKPHEEILKQLNWLGNRSAEFDSFWYRHRQGNPDFPASFLHAALTELPGVGKVAAKRLYDAGFHTRTAVKEATVEQLTAVKGIGRATALKILSF